jgi:hypothetical protein
MWVKQLCGAFNFDFKIDNGCFPLDSVTLMVKANVKGLNSELDGMNSIYLPRTTVDSNYSILYGKDEFGRANVSFKLYTGKRIGRYFYRQPLTSLPYDSIRKNYVISTDTLKIESRGLKDFTMLLKVNRDRYRALPEKNKYEFIYLNRQEEKITADIYSRGKRKSVREYKNIPIASIPFDVVTGSYIIDKNFLKTLDMKNAEMQKKSTAKR